MLWCTFLPTKSCLGQMIWSSQAFIFYAHPAVISLHLARVLQPADCLGGFVFTPALPWSGAQYSTRECDGFLHKHYQRSFTGGGNGGDGCGCGGDSCGGGTVKCGVCFHTSHHPERDPSPLSPLKSNISPLPNTSQGAKLILGACAS